MIDGAIRILVGGRFTCTPGWRRDTSDALPATRLYFPIRGSAWVACEGVRTPMRSGCVYLIPGYLDVTYGCNREMVLDWLHFEAVGLVFAASFRQLQSVQIWDAKSQSMWRPTYRSIGKTLSNPTPASSAELVAMTMHFAARALERVSPSSLSQREVELISRLEPAVQYMNDHDIQNPPLAEIAKTVHLSPEYFHRLFEETYRQTPFGYMLHRRMHHAMRILTTTTIQIAKIGEMCGYENPFYFSRVFKGHFGVNPRSARRGELAPY